MRAFLFFVFLGLILFTAHWTTSAPLNCNPGLLSSSDTPQTVIEKCGKPDHINAGTRHEQWVYPKGFPLIGGDYLYFDDGHFSSAQWEKTP